MALTILVVSLNNALLANVDSAFRNGTARCI